MDDEPQLKYLLRTYMQRLNSTPDRLAKRTGVPKPSIVNWVTGRVRRTHDWRALLLVAQALHLDEAEATLLLQAAGQPTIHELERQAVADSDKQLLLPWLLGPHSQHLSSVPDQILVTDTAALQLAEERLSQLPLDRLPAPAPLPLGSRMPLRRNPLFVGREAELLALARILKGGGTVAIAQTETAAVTGLGGIGKTNLALEFVHRYGQYFAGGVFWLSFADLAGVPYEIAMCGGAASLHLHPEFTGLSLDEQVQLVRAAWQSNLPRLLVFDNCEDEALLDAWRPTTGGCRILLTSRRASWGVASGVEPLALDVLARSESVALLRKYCPDLAVDEPGLSVLAQTLGDLPLALNLAGSWLARYRHVLPLADYRAHLEQAPLRDDALPEPAQPFISESLRPVARAFALSYRQLNPRDSVDALALALLARAAYFAPGEPIPRDVLLATYEVPTDDVGAALQAEQALWRLIELGLVGSAVAGALQMHRLIAQFTRSQLVDPAAQRDVERSLLDRVTAVNEASEFTTLLPIQSHLHFVVEQAIPRHDVLAAQLCEVFGYHLLLAGRSVQAEPYLERALAMSEHVPDPEPLQVASSCNLLGLVKQYTGKFTDARSLLERALATWQNLLDSPHPNIAAEHDNLGHLLMTVGEYPAAEAHLRQALQMHRELWGLESVKTARAVNNLGYFCLLQGRYTQAQRYLKLALKLRKQLLPAPHLSTAQTLNNLGEARYLYGAYSEALEYHQLALDMRAALFGEHHYDIAESLWNLARVQHACGDDEQARGNLERALEIAAATVGTDHFEAAYLFDSLGSLLRDQGAFADARIHLERALVIVERTLGAEHPSMAKSLNNLGLLLLAEGAVDAARPYLERALGIRRRQLGEEHPCTAESFRAYGELLLREGKTWQARSYFERALAILTQRLAREHPATTDLHKQLAAIHRLASL